jgi:hypothetical protein
MLQSRRGNQIIISCSKTFLFPESRSLKWDNVEKFGGAIQTTDGNIIWRMRFACWITKAKTHTLRMWNTYSFFTTLGTRKRHNFTLHVHWLSYNLTYPSNCLNVPLESENLMPKCKDLESPNLSVVWL